MKPGSDRKSRLLSVVYGKQRCNAPLSGGDTWSMRSGASHNLAAHHREQVLGSDVRLEVPMTAAYHQRKGQHCHADSRRWLAMPKEKNALLIQQGMQHAQKSRLETLEQICDRRVGELMWLQKQWDAKRDLGVEPVQATEFLELRLSRAVGEHEPVHLSLYITHRRQRGYWKRIQRLKQIAALVLGRDGVFAEPVAAGSIISRVGWTEAAAAVPKAVGGGDGHRQWRRRRWSGVAQALEWKHWRCPPCLPRTYADCECVSHLSPLLPH